MLGRCGDPIGFRDDADGPLAMTGSFPASAGASAGGPSHVSGTVTVTNRSNAEVRGVSAPAAEVFVVQFGTIVAIPVATDAVGMLVELAAGGRLAFTATAGLMRCDVAGRRLGAGHYEIHAVVRVLGTPDGRDLEVVGGPWPLAVT